MLPRRTVCQTARAPPIHLGADSLPMRPRLTLFTLLLAMFLAMPPLPAQAAACCLSASVFGIGRLAIWESAAFGWMTLGGHDTGRWDKQGTFRAFPNSYRQDEIRSEVWGIARLHERVQVFGRVPWVAGIREADGMGRHIGGGVGDLQAGARWDGLLAGEYKGWPAIALTATAAAPTSTRAEQATDPLGASTTGRGAWVGGLALAIEKAVLPWFVRVDLGATAPLGFERADLHAVQRYGMGWQAGLSGGRELVADRVVLGAQVVLDSEAPYRIDGVEEPDSGTRGLNAGLSLSWRLADVWTVTGSAASDVASGWASARNRTERWSATVGVRYAIQE